LSNPAVIHVVRPYQSEAEYLDAEAWSIEARTMILIGEPDLPEGTAVLFDVQIGNGTKPIRAEARVVESVPSRPGRPGGLRVRFRRYGAATKAFIDRAAAMPRTETSEGAESADTPRAAEPERAIPATNAESSGIHPRSVPVVAAPPDRDALLDRLRERARAAGLGVAGSGTDSDSSNR
jgi:hypothetical protein